jgi:hypothetical protein
VKFRLGTFSRELSQGMLAGEPAGEDDGNDGDDDVR